MILPCNVCRKPASPVYGCDLPVVLDGEVVLKRTTLCGKCKGQVGEALSKWLPIKKAEIITKFLKAKGVDIEGLVDYEGSMK